MEEAMIDFPKLLDKFTAAVVANDGAGLGALFAPDGVYADEFFGAHQGRAAMLRRFHDTGGDYRWDFADPVCDGTTGYARFRFSYVSRLPEAAGKPVVFEGISRFRLRDGLIERYDEAFDPRRAGAARLCRRAHPPHPRQSRRANRCAIL